MVDVVEIKTERLVLKKMSMKDLEDYAIWHSQESFFTFISGRPLNKKESKKELKTFVKMYKQKRKQKLVWGIYFDKRLIGCLYVNRFSSKNKCCEIGWTLNGDYTKKGFAFESAKVLMSYLFKQMGINKISAMIWHENLDSIKLAEKLGFVLEGTERQARIKNEKVFDVLHYGILKSEFEEKQKNVDNE